MRIGFAGLGAIGAPMAERLAERHELKVWNRSPDKAAKFESEHPGVRAVATISELGVDCDASVTGQPPSPEVAAIAGALAEVMSDGTTYVDCTSGDPGRSREIAATLAESGIRFVVALVSGGPPLARTG